MAQEPTVRKHIARVQAQLGTLASLAGTDATLATVRPKVSGWSIGQHVEHMLIVDRAVLASIEKILEGDHEGQGKPTSAGRVALAVGRFPRGLGKAPKAVQPRDQEPDAIRQMAADARRRLDALSGRTAAIATETGTRKHPLFGPFTPVQWLRFMTVHHGHHLRIVDDIMR